jgi:hypothetical protein
MKKPQNLPQIEKDNVSKIFEESNDFRSIGEKITEPIDSIIEKTMEVINKDPILNVSDELNKMNKDMSLVYKDIIDNDGKVMKFFKKLPVIGTVAKKADEIFDAASFNMQDVNTKISTIFSGFDQSYKSLNQSIDIQREFLEGIENNINKVIAYKSFISDKILEFKDKITKTSNKDEINKMEMFLRSVEFFLSNLIVLIGNLEMAKKRLLIRLDSAQKLSLAMNSSKPIFKTLLSSAVIEVSGQKAIDASIKAMEAMGSTIDKMSSELTDKAISGNKKAEEMSSKPILSSSVFIENVTKLKNHFAEIETFREQVMIEAKKEREEFSNAEKTLKNIKILNTKDQKELTSIIESGSNNL